ncbi:MAG: hypothetical protein HQL38_02295 [Alphaproteobacteria bacterium]|nr:hypothetical protein [Alphaproteobacteria bacterium]
MYFVNRFGIAPDAKRDTLSDPLDPVTVSIAEPTETVIVLPRFSYSFFWGQLSFR